MSKSNFKNYRELYLMRKDMTDITRFAIQKEYGEDAWFSFEKDLYMSYITEARDRLANKEITWANWGNARDEGNAKLLELIQEIGAWRYTNLKPFASYKK